MIDTKRFRSIGDDIIISNTLGHSAIITKELMPIPSILWGAAYAAGAVSEDMKDNNMATYIEEKKKEIEDAASIERSRIKGILKTLYNNPAKVVDANGKLSHRKAIVAIGAPVKRDILDAIWNELTEEDKG